MACTFKNREYPAERSSIRQISKVRIVLQLNDQITDPYAENFWGEQRNTNAALL
jgi:hypothetical protein